MTKFKPIIVFSIHGIRTYAHWQQRLKNILNGYKIKHKKYFFGYYGIFKFLFKRSNDKMVDNFYEFYSNALADTSDKIEIDKLNKRPSIVVHSFGSYILGYCLLKYPDVKFDKVILCGSILPRDFDWATIISRNQVNYILNDFGTNDIWTRIVKKFVPSTGSSGYDGFQHISVFLHQNPFRFKHSDYFNGQHIQQYWIPFLMKSPPRLTVKHGRDIKNREHFSAIFVKTTEMDKYYYGNHSYYDEVEPSNELALTWIDINPDIYTFLFDQRGSVQGYLNAMPVTRELFDRIIDGQVQDHEVTSEYILPFTPNSHLRIYLMSIAIAKNVRESCVGLFNEPLERLLNSYIEKLSYYFLQRKIIVSDFIAVGWTPEGIRLCELFGMKKISSDKYNNPIYILSLNDQHGLPPKEFYPGIHRLFEIYKSSTGREKLF